MEAVIIVLLLALLGGAGALGWVLLRRREPPEAENQQLAALSQALNVTQQTLLSQMNAVDGKLNQRLDAVQTAMGQSLDAVRTDVGHSMTATSETIGKINEQLGHLGQSAERILEVGQHVSSLRDILQPPKLRGGFGELLLEQLLAQILPASAFETQYRFANGDAVDVVIRTPEGLVPVDSKFPIDSFRRLLEASTDEDRVRMRKQFLRDVRQRIEEVAKYIRPEENTFDFALMYVPAENIYYEMIVGEGDDSCMTFALERGVNLVSPNTFYAFLQALVRGLNGLRVQDEAKQVLARLAQLKQDFGRFRQEFDVLGTHVARAKNKYEEIVPHMDRFGDRLEKPLSLQEEVQERLPEPVAAVPVNGGSRN